jgi:hypothetical protein
MTAQEIEQILREQTGYSHGIYSIIEVSKAAAAIEKAQDRENQKLRQAILNWWDEEQFAEIADGYNKYNTPEDFPEFIRIVLNI